ncbi:two-component system QseEF-associated lipoprotein QseG [Chimaeribacter arupi]|uniref:two-component system QseEF-associated lipoprotein QseG n=1 Tax=Chimaeribacter arupi TaxID=2060066 RepID=UPI002711FA15|nr:two-component system QseEF-associated lipoprotein QseG [Chimaeribacter arupi]WKZ93268.1 two-component system QseEF-associated lipoprotein QseG [Chimaeribacter arupi]
MITLSLHTLLRQGAGLAQAIRHGWRARLAALAGMPLLLVGCMQGGGQGAALSTPEKIPDKQVIDFRVASCDTLWDLDGKEYTENPLYWLRAMDCADRLGAVQARQLSTSMDVTGWENAFRQGILLSSAAPSPGERRLLLEKVNQHRAQMPGSLRPLVQLWRERQNLEIVLNDDRAKAQRAQELAASQLTALHQTQALLQNKLNDTRQKLENLTDIERQLSSRKQLQGELPESGENRGSTRPVEPDDTYTPPAAQGSRASTSANP